MAAPIDRTQLLLSQMVETSFGRMTLAGTIFHSPGIGWDKPRVLGSYALVYIVAGSGAYSDERTPPRPVGAGDLILLFPDRGHAYGPRAGEIWDEIYLVFDGALFDLLRRAQVLDAARPVLRLEPVSFWHRQIAAVAEAGQNRSTFQPAQVIALLNTLLINVAAAQRAIEFPDWVTAVCRELETADRPNWARLARQSGLSYDAFRKKFSVIVGMAPAKYRMARVLDQAGALLQESDLPLREIARMLGFADEYYFSKAFKRRMGFPPSVFREQVRGLRR